MKGLVIICLLVASLFNASSGLPYGVQQSQSDPIFDEIQQDTIEPSETIGGIDKGNYYFKDTIQKSNDYHDIYTSKHNPEIPVDETYKTDLHQDVSPINNNKAIKFNPYVDREGNDHYGVFGLGVGKKPYGPEYGFEGVDKTPDISSIEPFKDIHRNDEHESSGTPNFGISTGHEDSGVPKYDDSIIPKDDGKVPAYEGSGGSSVVPYDSTNKNENSPDHDFQPFDQEKKHVIPLNEEGKSIVDTDSHKSSTTWDYLTNYFNTAHDSVKGAAKSLENNLLSVYGNIQKKIPDVWQKFKDSFKHLGLMVHRGAEYVGQRVTHTLGEADASQLLTKLKKKMENGDEMVDSFFQKVGEKMTSWMDDHGHTDVDTGLLQQSNTGGQNFIDPTFSDLFKDEEIHQELDKLVKGGILRQDEMDLLTGNQKQEDNHADQLIPKTKY